MDLVTCHGQRIGCRSCDCRFQEGHSKWEEGTSEANRGNGNLLEQIWKIIIDCGVECT